MRWFKKQDYKSNLIAMFRDHYIGIDGIENGAGKTSLLTALQAIFYYFNNKKEYKFRKQKFKWYKLTGEPYGNQEVPLHAMYSSYENKLKIGKNPVEPHFVEYKEIRMPNKEGDPNKKGEEFQYFLHGSIITISEEIEVENGNLGDQTVDPAKLQFLKKKRHGHITLLAETQFLRRIAKWERERQDCLIYIWRPRVDKKRFGKLVKSIWYVWLYTGNEETIMCGFDHKPPLNFREQKQFEKGVRFGGREYIRECTLEFHGDITKYYNPTEYEKDFLKGCKKFTFRKKETSSVPTEEKALTKTQKKKTKSTASATNGKPHSKSGQLAPVQV